MTPEQQTQICQAALKRYGTIAQIDQLIEECAELIVAARHLQRGRIDEERQDFVEELADVQIMLMQMSLVVSEEAVLEAMDRKLLRLEERMSE